MERYFFLAYQKKKKKLKANFEMIRTYFVLTGKKNV